MKKTLTLMTILAVLFSGCSYKNEVYSNTFEKEKEVDRDDCKQKEAIYHNYNSTISIKENCLVTYDGNRTETYDQYEFNTPTYIGLSIIGPLVGIIYFPVSLLTFDKKSIKRSFIMLTYPITGPFYRPKNKDFISSYLLNKQKQTYKGEETLSFQDKVIIHPDSEMWIGNDKYKYPLKLNDDLTYSISPRLVNFFCANKDSCILNIYKRDDDETLTKFTTVNMKEF